MPDSSANEYCWAEITSAPILGETSPRRSQWTTLANWFVLACSPDTTRFISMQAWPAPMTATAAPTKVPSRDEPLFCATPPSAHSTSCPPGSSPVLYVIGTEVPAPGGESVAGAGPAVSSADEIHHTLELFRAAFAEQDVTSAWERVIGLVVQPGVEFGENIIFDYDRQKASSLSSALPNDPPLVYEAHSTDYQKPVALAEMVEDHFAILKVGPWLTFAFREAVFALSAIEHEWLGHRRGVRLSQVRDALEAAMLRNPAYWRSYYRGNEDEMRFARVYSYSDRCRYYWVDATVQQELAQLRSEP